MADTEQFSLQSKERFKKVMITDVAITKVPRIEYKDLTKEQNDALYEIAQIVLLRSKAENNSDEVAITVDLDDLAGRQGFQKGDEHEVEIDADPDSYHLLRARKRVAVVHNHPSTQTLSIEDVRLFLHHDPLQYIIVVTNQGAVHYLMKDKGYDFYAAEKLRAACCEDLNRNSSAKEFYNAALDFLTHCSEVGLYYS